MAKKSINKKPSKNEVVKAAPLKKNIKPKVKSKFAPKRGPASICKDRLEIIEYYLQGKNYREIATLISKERKYSISHATVATDVKFVLNEWKEQREDKVELYITIELAKIDKLEREYWEAWEKSKENYTAKANKTQTGTTTRGDIMLIEKAEREVIECGDPRFLQGIERCVQKRIDLLGLEAAKTLNIMNISETTVFRVKPKELDNVEMKAVS